MSRAAVPGPGPIVDAVLGYRAAKVLMVGAYLDLFTPLERPLGAAELAGRRALAPRGAEILLDALAATGWLSKEGGRYRNTPLSSRYLVRGSPHYMGENLKYQEIIWDAWSDLRACARRGRASRPLGHWLRRHPGFTREYIRGMDNIARGPSREIAALLDLRGARDLLDVGGGPGTYSRALLATAPRLRATVLDLPGTLAVTRELSAGDPAARRLRLRAADYRTASFGREAYDLVLLSHVTHDEGPSVNRALARKSFRALRPGGRVLIHDFLVREDRAAPAFGALFSVHMLAYTSQGRTYTAREYAGWLEGAGFVRVERRRLSASAKNGTHLLVGYKPY